MRTISPAIQPIIAGASAIPRTLYHIEMQDKATGAINHLYLTNHETNLVFGGITYQSYKIKHSNMKTYRKNQTDNCNITIDNVDRGMSSYFAYNEFSGQNAEVWKIFLDANLAPIGTPINGDYIVQFKGMMDRPKVNEERCEVRIVNVFNREQSYTPWRRFFAKCNWRFCGDECGYRGALKQLRGAANSGTTTTLTDTDIPSDAYNITDYWKGASLKILDGTNKGQIRKISTYNASTKTFTLDTPFSIAIDSTSKYMVECDKSKSTCKGFGNQASFGGFDEQTQFLQWHHRSQWGDKVIKLTGSLEVSGDGSFIPIIYGIADVQGWMLDSQWVGADYSPPVWDYNLEQWVYTPTHGYDSRIYAIAEGAMSSVEKCWINDAEFDISNPSYFIFMDGSPTQSFQFPVNIAGDTETKYYRRTAMALIKGSYNNKDVNADGYPRIWSSGSRKGKFRDVKFDDEVRFTVKGIEAQKYLANGTPIGWPVWSNNPAWCILDFLLNRASRKIDVSLIDFASFYNAAQLCDSEGYTLNLVISEQKKDPEILDLMLTACRGYFTYTAGKMELNIEAASSSVFEFDDASSGKTADNIIEGSFNYSQNDVNDTPNRIIVKYIDQEVRENMALTSSAVVWGTTTIQYDDLKGSFAASGTIDIEGIGVAYTGNSGTQLTGCTWPGSVSPSRGAPKFKREAAQRIWPSGYPIFQGAQTFPELTAIYNHYDNQDQTKRVIDKEVDGTAIPTYRHAIDIAEHLGKKSVEGNYFCQLKGMIDSLKLTVGDVVKITHALPGWVDEEFRITEASESEDEEVDYTLELYDGSFYAERDVLPGVNLATTLPNPWAVPGHVTGLSLSEDGYTNTDGSYVPTLTLTYTLPSGDAAIFWGRARVQISKNGGANYSDYGYDSSRGSGFTIDAATGGFKTGDAVYVRVISVNSNNIMADASTAPTVSNKIDGLIVAPLPPRGLMIEGNPDPNNTIWDGLRFALTWWKQSQTGGAGNEGSLGAGGFVDPYWNGDEYELWVGGTRIDSGNTKEARYDYVYGDGYLAFLDAKISAANGAVIFKVRRVSFNQASDWSTITITQKAPAYPANLSGTGMSRSVLFTWDANTEADFSHYSVRTKIGTGGVWGAWGSIQSNNYLRTFTQAELTGGSLTVHIEAKAVDLYKNESGIAASNAATWMIVPDEIYTTLRTDFWVRDSIFYFDSTTLTWTVGSITRGADNCTLAASTLAGAINKYVIATLSGGTATLSLADMTAGIPALNADQVIIATTSALPNTAGNYLCYVRQANSMMIEGAIIRDTTITSAKIANAAITNAKIASATITDANIGSLNADKIVAGSIDVNWAGGNIRSGQTAFATGTGFWLGNDGGTPKFSIGDATKYLKWDGSNLSIRGTLNADDIVAGAITGRTLQTATSGRRFVISATNGDAFFYDMNNSLCVQITDGNYGSGWGPLSGSFFGFFGDGVSSTTAINAISAGGSAIKAWGRDGGFGIRCSAHSGTPGAYEGYSIWADCQGRLWYPSGGISYVASPLCVRPGPTAGVPTHQAWKGSLWVDIDGILYINTSVTDLGATWAKVGAQ